MVEEEMVRDSGPNPFAGKRERMKTSPVIPGVKLDR